MSTNRQDNLSSDSPPFWAESLLEVFSKPREASKRPGVEHALERLEWPRLCEALSQRCATEAAQLLALRHVFLDEVSWLQRRLAEVGEMANLIAQGYRPPIAPVAAIDADLERALRGGAISLESLKAIGDALQAMHALRRALAKQVELAPMAWQWAQTIAPLEPLDARINNIFGPDGQLADHASPELGMLRKRVRRLHEGLRKEIEERAHHKDTEDLLQDAYFTIREGRYVLPVKTQMRTRIRGIVHATSSSGQTVFVEPQDLVAMNNHLRMADFDVIAEEKRIVASLSTEVAKHAPAIAANLRRYVYLDLLRASAELSLDLKATPAAITKARIDLRLARHPLLVLKHLGDENAETSVVPNTITIEPETSTLVVSGSNAGGKTVTLKTVGLCALMARAGLPVSAASGSECPLFEAVYTSIGDEQSLADDTSTFSAQIKDLSEFVEDLDGTSLVLLDEPFAGTDPDHAAALGIALLEHMHERGARGVVTTHLDRTKVYAMEHDWLANASVSFDVEHMRPTFKLRLGTPGGSSALRIATAMGLSESIVERAKELRLQDATGDLEQVLNGLEAERRALEASRREQEAEADRARDLQERLEESLRRARNAQLDALGDEARAFREELRDARERLAAHVHRMQLGETAADALQAEEMRTIREELESVDSTLSEAERAVDDEAHPRHKVPDEALVPGLTVWSRTYKREAEVLGVDGRGRVELRIGLMATMVKADDLRMVEVAPRPKTLAEEKSRGTEAAPRNVHRGGATTSSKRHPRPVEVAPQLDSENRPMIPQTPGNTCDLRGMRGDEAVERVEFFLDEALRGQQPTVHIIHGHGTGILKRLVREYLATSVYIDGFRPGERTEGGDGVTVAWLRD